MRILAILALSLFAALISAEPANVAGKWNVTLQLESITGHPVILLKQDGEKLTGTYEGRYGQSELKGSIKEKEIEFSVSIVAEGMQTQGVFAGKVDGDSMSGEVSYEGAGDGTWTATRVKQ
jgi:D-glucosaminate-6-phosphate ammonia-lyase